MRFERRLILFSFSTSVLFEVWICKFALFYVINMHSCLKEMDIVCLSSCCEVSFGLLFMRCKCDAVGFDVIVVPHFKWSCSFRWGRILVYLGWCWGGRGWLWHLWVTKVNAVWSVQFFHCCFFHWPLRKIKKKNLLHIRYKYDFIYFLAKNKTVGQK